MNLLTKLEHQFLKWFKGVPHLPIGFRQWLGMNLWWLVLIYVVVSGIFLLFALFGLFASLAVLGTVASAYTVPGYTAWVVINAIVTLAFGVLEVVLAAMAIKPLQNRQKKGWVLLFATLLVTVVALVLTAVLTMNPLTFVTSVLFGGIFVAVAAYLLFEVHGEFAHVERSAGIKAAANKAE